MFAPVVRLCLQQHDAIARMRRALDQQQQVNEVLVRKLAQARRDCSLLVDMARDRDTAEAFLRDAHEVDDMEQTA